MQMVILTSFTPMKKQRTFASMMIARMNYDVMLLSCVWEQTSVTFTKELPPEASLWLRMVCLSSLFNLLLDLLGCSFGLLAFVCQAILVMAGGVVCAGKPIVSALQAMRRTTVLNASPTIILCQERWGKCKIARRVQVQMARFAMLVACALMMQEPKLLKVRGWR